MDLVASKPLQLVRVERLAECLLAGRLANSFRRFSNPIRGDIYARGTDQNSAGEFWIRPDRYYRRRPSK